MKLGAWLVVFLLVSAGRLRADLTITQKVDGLAGVHDMVVQIKGDKARIEATPAITTIIDSKTGAICTLLNDKQQVMRISAEKARAMAEMARQFNAQKKEAANPKFVPTGRKETINGYPCEEYRLEGKTPAATFWLTTKYPDYRAILDQLARLRSSAWDITKEGMPDYKNLPGLPMRVVVDMPGHGQVTNTMVSIRQDAIPAERFEVPANYHEMELPDFSKFKRPAAPAGKQP